MPQVQDRSLDLLTCNPTCHRCATIMLLHCHVIARQMGLTNNYINTQLDPFASKLRIFVTPEDVGNYCSSLVGIIESFALPSVSILGHGRNA